MKKECYVEAANLISSNLEEAKNYLLPLIAKYDPDVVASSAVNGILTISISGLKLKADKIPLASSTVI